jgi:hypothetical protein
MRAFAAVIAPGDKGRVRTVVSTEILYGPESGTPDRVIDQAAFKLVAVDHDARILATVERDLNVEAADARERRGELADRCAAAGHSAGPVSARGGGAPAGRHDGAAGRADDDPRAVAASAPLRTAARGLRRDAPYNPSMALDVAVLPGADLIREGIADLSRGVLSVPALLVAVGAPRLRALGLAVPAAPPRPERLLYLLLARGNPDGAHAQYNALVRRLVSFERALACAR